MSDRVTTLNLKQGVARISNQSPADTVIDAARLSIWRRFFDAYQFRVVADDDMYCTLELLQNDTLINQWAMERIGGELIGTYLFTEIGWCDMGVYIPQIGQGQISLTPKALPIGRTVTLAIPLPPLKTT